MGRTRSRSSSSSLYIVSCLQCLCVLIGIFVLITHCDAKELSPTSPRAPNHSSSKAVKRFDVYLPLDSNSKSYGVSSPFNLPPYESLAPIPLPENSPPYCVYPPPSTTVPSPAAGGIGGGGGGGGGYIPSPPMLPSPPQNVPYYGPPQSVPSPTEPSMSPPWYYEPSPPTSIIPSPTGSGPYVPTPFLPPVVYPPPSVPPPPSTAAPTALWCVAKPAVPEPIIQEAMNYACASGAECDQIQPSGSCFQPDTLFAHASYAFNSYWQRTKQAGGTCEFGSTAMLVTVDPSKL
nr:leucine-rich repeat extensin-like protein 5 [Ipomoea batatas]